MAVGALLMPEHANNNIARRLFAMARCELQQGKLRDGAAVSLLKTIAP